MKEFIGTKRILAKPMTRVEYNTYRGWELPENENGSDAGYLVEYLDSPDANHPNHAHYISWSPAEQFTQAYQDVSEGMSFGHAIEMMKQGLKVARTGWNGKGMYIYLVPAAEYKTVTPVAKKEHGESFMAGAYLTMKPAAGPMVIGWLASQSDMLADDWIVV